MFSHTAPSRVGSRGAASTSHPARLGDQSIRDNSRRTWSEPYCERLRLEHRTVLAEFDAVSGQFFNGLMTVYQYQDLSKCYITKLNALLEELDEETKKEPPSMAQRALDWGYTPAEAEKMEHDLTAKESSNYNSSMNTFLYRRNVRGH
ncbi:hypothetical protein DENSPDRAFT_526032 [Dentipellis sp. KUC8613]|nr:hypothetical protein DENSPDRAFT_526032 [Dentipellis sp. KUC8613]